jgi:hypothetical protein
MQFEISYSGFNKILIVKTVPNGARGVCGIDISI